MTIALPSPLQRAPATAAVNVHAARAKDTRQPNCVADVVKHNKQMASAKWEYDVSGSGNAWTPFSDVSLFYPPCPRTPELYVTRLRMLTLQNLNITREGGTISNQALVYGRRVVTVTCRLGIAGEPDEIELSNDIVASLSMMMSWRRGK